jgi:transcriptional regulator with XRE-family HTH domain
MHMDKEWFKSRKKEVRVTDAIIAQALNLDRTVINKLMNGSGEFTAKRIDVIARLLRVTRDEIMFRAGIEQAAPEPQALDMARAPDQMPTRSAYSDAGPVKLRRVNLELAMGDGTHLEDWFDEDLVDFDPGWLRSITSTPTDRLIVGRGIGDSMGPTIGDQDDVMINLDENRLTKLDGIYAITIEGAGAIKRLMPGGDKTIEVLSDNPAHPNRVRSYPREAINIIGRIIWSGRRH